MSTTDALGLTGDDASEQSAAPIANPRTILTAVDRAALRAIADLELRFDEPMSRHTTLQIGGAADVLALPATSAAALTVAHYCAAHDLPLFPLGGGSNLLVRDGGIRGVVLGTRRMRGIHVVGPRLTVDAGALTSKVLTQMIAAGLGGGEFLGGVPGTIGGGLIMNAGTYLGEFKDIVESVTSLVLDRAPHEVTRDNAACGFGYRTSRLPPSEVVLRATLRLVPTDPATMRATVRDLRARRLAREPKGLPSAGSIFKNPPNDFAGRLIEAAGCKGWHEGGSLCSPVHANWLVNQGGATAQGHLRLMTRIQDAVWSAFGVRLEPEVKVVGED